MSMDQLTGADGLAQSAPPEAFAPDGPPLATAGSLAAKRPAAQSAGTLGVENATFGVMLLAVILFIGALTFFPVAAVGPIAEHLLFMN